MVNLSARLEKLRKQAQRVIAAEQSRTPSYPENCICFPRGKVLPKPGVARLIFGRSEHLELALSIPCPLHGQRFDPDKVAMIYQAGWLLEGFWERQWADFDPQTRKAMRATFKTRESYGLPSTTDDLLADQP